MLVSRTALWLAIAVFPASSTFADPDKDESGKGQERRGEWKEEYRDGSCKVEKKWEKNGGYKEERKCEGRQRATRDHDSHLATRVEILTSNAMTGVQNLAENSAWRSRPPW